MYNNNIYQLVTSAMFIPSACGYLKKPILFSIYFVILILYNNYSPKWRWLAVDIYRAAKQQGKYPTLATDTEVNSCFLKYVLKQ